MRHLFSRHTLPALLVLAVALVLIAPSIDAGTLRARPDAPADNPRLENPELKSIAGASCTVTLTCAGGTQVQCSSATNQCSTSSDGNCVVCNGQTQGCCQQTLGECIDDCIDQADECRAGCGGFGACLFFCNNLEDRCIDRCFGN